MSVSSLIDQGLEMIKWPVYVVSQLGTNGPYF